MTRDKTKTKHYFHVVYKENIVYTPVKYAVGFVLELGIIPVMLGLCTGTIE